MGIVYRARDEELNRGVAVKVLAAGALGHLGKDHLLKEAQTASALNHPNIWHDFQDWPRGGRVLSRHGAGGRKDILSIKQWLPSYYASLISPVCGVAQYASILATYELAYRPRWLSRRSLRGINGCRGRDPSF
jgi:hypothetical protein